MILKLRNLLVVMLAAMLVGLSPIGHALETAVVFGNELTGHLDRQYGEIAIQSAKERYFNWRLSQGFWSNETHTCASGLIGRPSGRVQLDLGVCSGDKDVRVESREKYRLGVWVHVSPKWDVGYLHFSCNSSAVRWLPGCRDGEVNIGMDFLVGQLRFGGAR